ncbi:MAG: adenylosuccinate lyase [Bacteroidetes bacterium]|nr:MAG: adenylosuccinate lyase [Bacteroidota bacterium]
MSLNSLTAISPVDGRYRAQTQDLENFFSEAALIRYRLLVETEYFIALCKIPLSPLADFPHSAYDTLRERLLRKFTLDDAEAVKNIEKTTNHDVKAVEYFMKERLDEMGLGQWREFVHFGLTSQDINNTATPLLLKEAWEKVLLPLYVDTVQKLDALATEWDNIPMLARTHGQPASPTRLGKEIRVFVERLLVQLKQVTQVPFSAKFGGATGNFNAHKVTFPGTDWRKFGNDFVSGLGLVRSQFTTQIEHYDNMAAFFDGLKRLNTILIDLDRDMWSYISVNYFRQKIKEGEVGSSAMPHKVNPIDFENSEGNFGLANAMFEHLSAKLPVSRLQRDLTDSTVLRTIGVPIAHSLIALKSLHKGLGKLLLNEEAISRDLEDNWAVVAEAIQTILRRENYPNPYEALKALTRTNEKVTGKTIADFIETLSVSEDVKKELRAITPQNYTGI